MTGEDARRAIENAARESWSRLVAFLAVRSRDLTAAEDALAEAFHAALKSWPHDGVPDKPEAWLLTAARRKLIDEARHSRVHTDALPGLRAAADEAQELAGTEVAFPDERLKLLFVCAHPAIDASARTPLMLQMVLGLDAARIASAFLVKPSAMGQRLSRAKTKIRDAGIAFELPATRELPARLDAVLEAIYAAYGSGWEDVAGADPRRKGLATEAIDLGRVLTQLMPAESEVQGLLSLMLHCDARRDARLNDAGQFVPLSEQDAARWSKPLLDEADRLLEAASHSGKVGRFQLQAAIQSVHARRATTGATDWDAIAVFYEALVRLAPTIGALVGRAAAHAKARDATAGLTLLEAIPADAVKNYQPYWALAAHLFRRLRRFDAATEAYGCAIGLCEDPTMRDFLLLQTARLRDEANAFAH